jgi:hypothetical protein
MRRPEAVLVVTAEAQTARIIESRTLDCLPESSVLREGGEPRWLDQTQTAKLLSELRTLAASAAEETSAVIDEALRDVALAFEEGTSVAIVPPT